MSDIHRKAMAELGGYNEWWPNAAAGLSYCIGMSLTLGSMFMGDFGTGILAFFTGIGLFTVAFVVANSEYEKCYQRGLKIQSINEAQYHAEEAERKQNYSDMRIITALELRKKGGLKNLQQSLDIFNEEGQSIEFKKTYIEMAREKERLLDYEGAIDLFEKANHHDDAKRVRRKMLDEKKVDQTVVQGDQITKTEIKDSVLNRSNIGAGGDDKLTKIKELKELHDAGAIDDDEFKQMKKEILGK